MRLNTLAAADYAEDGGGPREGVSPVFVSIIKAEIGDKEQIRREAEDLTEAIAVSIRRPAENVHLIYGAPSMGRISFGGRLLTE